MPKIYVANQENGPYESDFGLKKRNEVIEKHPCNSDYGQKPV